MTVTMLPHSMMPSVVSAAQEYEVEMRARAADPLLSSGALDGFPPASTPRTLGQTWAGFARVLMARLVGEKPVALGSAELAEFRDFYSTGLRAEERQGGARYARLTRSEGM